MREPFTTNTESICILGFDDFSKRAADPGLGDDEKSGWPSGLRAGCEEAILEDIAGKLPALGMQGKTIVEIGPGCTRLPKLLIEHCSENGHRLVMIDSAQVLATLPDRPFLEKVAARFPCREPALQAMRGRVDAVLAYSVLQSVFLEGSVFAFLDEALQLLAPSARLLLGDVPNASKRKRFLASEAGVRFHKQYMKTSEPPEVRFSVPEPGQMDDAVVLALVARARAQGFDAYVVPQAEGLPMANRREDLLLVRP